MKLASLIAALAEAACAATLVCAACISAFPCTATAAEVGDATGRTVTVPDHIQRVLPAGPPAAVLLAAIAPDRMIGFPGPVSATARDALDQAVNGLPVVPRLTGPQEAITEVQSLHPDLILDYGSVAPRYAQLAQDTQRKTGIPTLLLDGALENIPAVARTLGKILEQPERGESVARLAEAILALPKPPGSGKRVLYARGGEGTIVAAAGTDVTAVFVRLGWQVLAPDGSGTFRPAGAEAIAALDPDIVILADPAAKDVLGTAPWRDMRAVRDGHAYIAPSVPFGWIEEPPSINRLLGFAWLRGGDPLTLAALFNSVVYGRTLTQEQLQAIAGATPSITP